MMNIHCSSLDTRVTVAVAVALMLACVGAKSQSGKPTPNAPPVKVAMLDLAFYGKRANDLLPNDSAMAMIATSTMRAALAQAPGLSFADSATVAQAATSPEAKSASEGKPCNVIVACARSVGQQLGTKWVIMGKISKTSDLIWIFSGELIDVATGKLVLDDSYELKGIASDMVPKGAQVFARRVAKKMVAGDSAAVQ
jgi:hypothetical protein